MATLPVKIAPDGKAAETTEQRFRRLEAVWEAETLYLSDAHKIIEHPAFQEIIGMGEAVIPFMLRDLEKEPRQWVWALPRITGANPVRPEDAGNSRKLADAWLRWGREKGYQWWATSGQPANKELAGRMTRGGYSRWTSSPLRPS